MRRNIYVESARRWFAMVVGAMGSVVFLMLVAVSLVSGKAPTFGRRSLALPGQRYALADHPSQFWFSVALDAGFALFLGWVAWRAWRERA